MPQIPAALVDPKRHPCEVISLRVLQLLRPPFHQPGVLLHMKGAHDGCGHETRKESHPRFNPGFVEQHLHDRAFTFSRKISFSEMGSTSMLPALSMRMCSMIKSRLRLEIKDTVRPSSCTRSIPGSRKSRSSTGSGKTAWMWRYCSFT